MRFTIAALARIIFLTLVTTLMWRPVVRASDTCTNPTSVPSRGEALEDHPGERSGWFFSGRKDAARTGLAAAGTSPPPARTLLRSVEQVNQMPRPGLAAAQPSWIPLGPSPVHSLYWGSVSGRVTTLSVDNRATNHVLYVGTAYGGLWRTADFTSPSPHFEALGDTTWPSLAVGSIALDTTRAEQPPVIYVGTGEGNESSDSYYGIGILKSTDGGTTWALSTGSGSPVPLSSSARFNLDGPFVGAAVARIVIDSPTHSGY